MNMRRIFLWLFLGAVFLPRLIVPDDFFIQDEQPWIDRSQTYANALFSGDFTGAVQYPLSNHPAIPLLTTLGPVMNLYGSYHGLEGTYNNWPLDDKREAAVWARYAWGIICSIALLLLYLVISNLNMFAGKKWAAGLVIVLLGLEPWILGISRSVSVDVLMAIGVIGMLASAAVAYEKRSIQWVLYSGFWFALAFVSKSPALITAPIALILASITFPIHWNAIWKRALVWGVGAFGTAIVLWPPFLLHPIDRVRDVFARAELHSTVQEIYQWPGFHPPLFLFTLSAFATVGCLLYIWNRVQDTRTKGTTIEGLDIVFLAGVFHGLVLLYLHGDHARKNLPVLAVFGFIGAVGWVWWLSRHKVSKEVTVISLLILQGIFMWPYFPHVISSSNVLFPSVAGKRLLVDVGNGSRLAAEYINAHDNSEVYAVPMDSLIAPYLDGDMRNSIRSMPSEGKLENIDPQVTNIIVPASLPARVSFDSDAKQLLKELQNRTPETVLSVRDVPMFYIYTLKAIEYTSYHETSI